jgi:hypothetical protein
MRGMLCEKCRMATATRETTEADKLPGPARKTVGRILCARCRADAKAGARAESLSKRLVNPTSAHHHKVVGGSAR